MNHKLIHLIEKCVNTATKIDISNLILSLKWNPDIETYEFIVINDNIRATGYSDASDTGVTSVCHINREDYKLGSLLND